MRCIGLLVCLMTLLGGPVLAQLPPRDPRPIDHDRAATEAAQRAAEALEARIAKAPLDVALRLELAKLLEEWGRYDEAEATLLAARAAVKPNAGLLLAVSGFYNRMGNFEKTMEYLQAAADLEPTNPASHQRVAVFYWEKAFRDPRLTKEQRRAYLDAGIAATDKALAIDIDYAEALTYKNILLRLLANDTEDRAEQHRLLEEADRLRNRAIELNRLRAIKSVKFH